MQGEFSLPVYTGTLLRELNLKNRGIIGQKLLEYMSFKAHYETVGPKEEIPVNEILERIPPEIVLELYAVWYPSVRHWR